MRIPKHCHPNQENTDDGKTIADMNVEGMPWYVPGDENRKGGTVSEPLTPQQMRQFRWAALKAGLLVVAVFGGTFFMFLLFCDFVWFR